MPADTIYDARFIAGSYKHTWLRKWCVILTIRFHQERTGYLQCKHGLISSQQFELEFQRGYVEF